MGGIYFHSFGASILSIAIIQCISFWGNERLPVFSPHFFVFYFFLSLFYWALNINNQPSLIQLILQILIFFMPSTIKPKRRLMKAEEMVRVIKNQFFLFGNPGGVNTLISHLHSVISPRGILSFVDSQDAGGPLPSFSEPFSFKVLRSQVSHGVTGPSLGGLLTSGAWEGEKELCSPEDCCALLSILPTGVVTAVAQGTVRKRLLWGRESTSRGPGRQESCD